MAHEILEDLGDWYHTVKIDLAQAHEYAKAVFQMSEDFAGSRSEVELARTFDMGFDKGSRARLD